jgi:hypothetical protein
VGEREFVTLLDEIEGTARIRNRIRTVRGGLADGLAQLELLWDDEWRAVTRYDCAHGFFHKDELFPDGTSVKTRMEFATVAEFLECGRKDILERWRWYCDRYVRRMPRGVR